jgi:hypothetical protein
MRQKLFQSIGTVLFLLGVGFLIYKLADFVYAHTGLLGVAVLMIVLGNGFTSYTYPTPTKHYDPHEPVRK